MESIHSQSLCGGDCVCRWTVPVRGLEGDSVSLEPRQLRFCQEYIIDLNGTQAAIRAGYSEDSARAIASENLTKPDIEAKIQELKDLRSLRTEITADKVLTETYLLAASDIGEAFNEDGSLKPIKEIPSHIRKAISSVEVDELFEGHGADKEQVGYTRKIKLWDKVKTLELLGKHLKVFSDKVELTADASLASILTEMMGKKPDPDASK
jgi:phage terminase small subunit